MIYIAIPLTALLSTTLGFFIGFHTARRLEAGEGSV